jgi:hypothetical protein
MAFGLQFTNNSGVVTLDSEYARLCVICSGRYGPTQESNLGSVTQFPAPITTQEPPLVFIRPDTVGAVASASLCKVLGSPGNWTGFYVRAFNVFTQPPSGRYFAAAFRAVASAPFGLRLWDGASNMLFDSGTPSAVFTRAYQTWTYVKYESGSQGDTRNYFTVDFNFPEDEYMLINNIGMSMVCGSAAGRLLGTLWDFPANKLWLVASGSSNPVFIYLPTIFAKMNA